MALRNSFVLTGTANEIRSYRALKVLAAAKFSSLPISICLLHNPEDVLTRTNSVLEKGLALTLPGGNTHVAGSVNSMMRVIASFSPGSELSGISLLDSAIVDSWVQFGWTEIEVPMSALLEEREMVQSSVDTVKKQIHSALVIVDRHLQQRNFMVGPGTTNADIAICSALKAAASSHLWDPTASHSGKDQGLLNVTKWFDTVTGRDFFVSAFRDFNLDESCGQQESTLTKRDKSS